MNEFLQNMFHRIGWDISELGFFIIEGPSEYIKMREDYNYVISAVCMLGISHCLFAIFGITLERWMTKPKRSKSKSISNVLDEQDDKPYKLRVNYLYPPNSEKWYCKFLRELEGKEAIAYKDVITQARRDHKPIEIDGRQWFVVSIGKMCDGVSEVVNVQPMYTVNPEDL